MTRTVTIQFLESLSSATIRDLKAICKEWKLTKYSSLTKAQLLVLIKANCSLESIELGNEPAEQAIAAELPQATEPELPQATEPGLPQEIAPRGEQPDPLPTWADVASTAKLVLGMSIATAIWLGRRTRRWWDAPTTQQTLHQAADWLAWQAAGALGWRITLPQEAEPTPQPTPQPTPTPTEALQAINIARIEAGQFPLPLPHSQAESARLSQLPITGLEQALDQACHRSPCGYGRVPDAIYLAAPSPLGEFP